MDTFPNFDRRQVAYDSKCVNDVQYCTNSKQTMIPGSRISHEAALGVRLSFPEVNRHSIVEHADITLLRPGTVVRRSLPIQQRVECRQLLVCRRDASSTGDVARMHLTLKKEASKPAAANVLQQLAAFDTLPVSAAIAGRRCRGAAT
jgi:hypothetical protein